MQINLLQKYIFISLDIFKKWYQNNIISNKLDAWLAFLCMDDPDVILTIIDTYPEFEPMYEQAYDICLNMEEVMGMFSKELYELDKNTVQYMMDEMQEEIDRRNADFEEKKKELQEMKDMLEEKRKEAQKMKSMLEEKSGEAQEMKNMLEEKRKEAQKMKSMLEEKSGEVQEMKSMLEEKSGEAQEMKDMLEVKNVEVQELKRINAELKKQLAEKSM